MGEEGGNLAVALDLGGAMREARVRGDGLEERASHVEASALAPAPGMGLDAVEEGLGDDARGSPRTRRRLVSPSTGPTCTPRRSRCWSCRSNQTCCSKSLAGSRSAAPPWACRQRSGMLAKSQDRRQSHGWRRWRVRHMGYSDPIFRKKDIQTLQLVAELYAIIRLYT